MLKCLLAVVLSALAMFVWGAVYWMNPAAEKVIGSLENEADLSAAMLASMPESGVYFLPDAQARLDDPEGFTARHEAGPLAMIVFHREGFSPMDPMLMFKGFVHELIVVAGMAALLTWVGGSFRGYLGRFLFVLSLGVLMGFYSRIGDTIWMLHPAGWGFFGWGYTIGAWASAGAVLAAMIKPKRA